MLWPPPRTPSGRPCARANSTAATTSPVSSGWTATAGVRSIMPFHSRVASSNPASPGRSSRPFSRVRSSSRAGGAALAISGRSTARNSSGRSTGGSSPQSSITSSGQPKRSLACSAIEVGVARAWRPQTRVAGTGSRRAPPRESRGARARPSSGRAPPGGSASGAVDVVRGERRPELAHPARAGAPGRARSAARGDRACARSAPPRTLQRGAEVRRRVERGEAERIDQHERPYAVAIAGGEARRDRAAERVARRGPAATRRFARSARRARRTARRCRAALGRSDAPWPGRSGAITRWARTRSGNTRIQWVALAPGPCSRMTGGPSPPSSTAVETPASINRRSLDGQARSVARGRCRRVDLESSAHCHAVAARPHRQNHPTCAARAAWVVSTERLRRAGARTRRPSPRAREDAPSLAKMLLTCRSTVRSLRTSACGDRLVRLRRPRRAAAPAARAA